MLHPVGDAQRLRGAETDEVRVLTFKSSVIFMLTFHQNNRQLFLLLFQLFGSGD